MRKNLLKAQKGIYKDPRDINDDEQDDDTKILSIKGMIVIA